MCTFHWLSFCHPLSSFTHYWISWYCWDQTLLCSSLLWLYFICTAHSKIDCWHDTDAYLSVTLCVVLNDTLCSKCLNKWTGSAPRNTILQLPVSYTDPIPSYSSPQPSSKYIKSIQANFHNFHIVGMLCGHSRQCSMSGFLSNSWASCYRFCIVLSVNHYTSPTHI